jgi:hypothetical protein
VVEEERERFGAGRGPAGGGEAQESRGAAVDNGLLLHMRGAVGGASERPLWLCRLCAAASSSPELGWLRLLLQFLPSAEACRTCYTRGSGGKRRGGGAGGGELALQVVEEEGERLGAGIGPTLCGGTVRATHGPWRVGLEGRGGTKWRRSLSSFVLARRLGSCVD